MDKIKQLEIKKLLKELDYLESDFEYKSEIVVENDAKFMREVSAFLDSHPELKELFNKKVNDKIESIIKENQKNENTDIIKSEEDDKHIEQDEKPIEEGNNDGNIKEEEISDTEDTIDDKSPKLRKLYREIVKVTHPDRVKNKRLNDIYIKATSMYDKNDLAGIYSICSELKIEYEIDEDDAENITTKIKSLKDRIGFTESTITWVWHHSKTQQEKDQIILYYIKMQIK